MPKQIDWEKKDKQMQMEAANESLARSLSLANNFAKRGGRVDRRAWVMTCLATNT